MKFDHALLKEFCSIHSVAGDTLEATNYFYTFLKRKKIPVKLTDYGVLTFGNIDKPKVLVSAHLDEVGFQIIGRNQDGTFNVNKSGHVSPDLLNNSPVYVQTQDSSVEGIFLPKLELGNNHPENFNQIFLDVLEPKNISIGDFGSYKRYYTASDSKVIATGLDNKISLLMIMELINQFPSLLEDVMFSFVTEEETTYNCIRGLTTLYKPEYALILDMCPVYQPSQNNLEVIPQIGGGGAILYAFNKYKLHPRLRKGIMNQVKTPFQKCFLSVDFPPEVEIVEANGVTKAMNVFIPMRGWHNSSYSMNIEDYFSTKKLSSEIINILIKT